MRRSILGAFVLAVGTLALTQPAVAKCVSGAPRCPKINSVRAVIRGLCEISQSKGPSSSIFEHLYDGGATALAADHLSLGRL